MEKNVNNVGSITGGIAFSAAVVVYVFINLIFSIICIATGFSAVGEDGEVNSAYIYVSYLIAPLSVGISLPIVLKKRNVPFARVMPFKTQSPKKDLKWCAVAVTLAFGLLFSLSWLNVGFEKLLRLCGYEGTQNYFPDLSGGWVALALIVMAVIPAVFEETLFRGAVLSDIREEAGELNSVFLCGMCFALFHASALQTIYQFICGCAFALLFIRSRSLAPCILAHFLNNAVIIILQACGLDTAGSIFDWAPLWAAILVTALSALSLLGSAAVLVFDKTPLAKGQKGGVKKFFLAAAVGIVVLAILWIAGLFV